MNRNQQTNLTKITSSMSFGLSLDDLAGSGLTDDEETTATSGPDEAVISRMLLWTSPSSLHTAVCGHFRSYKNAQTYKSSHFNNTMSFDFFIRSNEMIFLYIFVSGFPPFYSQMLPSPCLAGPAPPQKICSKSTGIKNQKSAVIALFEIKIIKLQLKI